MLGVWPSIKNGFTNLMNSASGFMFGKDEEDDNRDDVVELDADDKEGGSNSEIRKLEDAVEILAAESKQSLNV